MIPPEGGGAGCPSVGLWSWHLGLKALGAPNIVLAHSLHGVWNVLCFRLNHGMRNTCSTPEHVFWSTSKHMQMYMNNTSVHSQ